MVLVLLGALSSELRAAEPPQKPAKIIIKEGNTAYRLGKFDEALELYEKAYKRLPEPRLLFNLAQCHRQLGHLEKAVFLYRNFLEHFPLAPNKAFVEQTIAQLEKQRADEKRKAEEARRAQEQARQEALAREKAALTPVPVVTPAPPLAAVEVAPAPPPPRPWYRRWYVWTPIALAVAGGGAAAAAVLLTRRQANPAIPDSPSGNMFYFGAK
jgi:tetratricopeptide (TPR) repeat protein